MDLSTEYVMMCEAAKEIQEMVASREMTNKDFVASKGSGAPIWLPRQDQLVDMMISREDEDTADAEYNSHTDVLAWKTKKLSETIKKNPAIISMEMAWLATVMKYFYAKTWNLVKKEWEVI